MDTIQVHIFDVALRQRDISLPARCPECGEKLSEVGLDVNHALTGVSVISSVTSEGEVYGWDESDFDKAVYYPTYYSCGRCETVLASGTFQLS